MKWARYSLWMFSLIYVDMALIHAEREEKVDESGTKNKRRLSLISNLLDDLGLTLVSIPAISASELACISLDATH